MLHKDGGRALKAIGKLLNQSLPLDPPLEMVHSANEEAVQSAMCDENTEMVEKLPWLVECHSNTKKQDSK